MLRTLGLLSITLTSVAAHPCETEHFASCPEHGPDTLGKCLAGLPSLSDECKKWTTIHDACLDVLKSECKTRCGGEPCHYRDDAVACLTEWTAADKITKECAAVLPERKVVEEEVESDAKKKRRQKRKNRRKKGGEEVKKYHANHIGMNYALKLYHEGDMTVKKICEITNISRASIYRKLVENKGVEEQLQFIKV